ncbi:MAG: DUF3828 domain-containing protein [Deltaproteobacteria bacterium]|nr:DUF3828 domain-containing protein [Deltaproteobacteria bacterium]
MHLLIISLIIILTFINGCSKTNSSNLPVSAVEHFYKTYLTNRTGGLPYGHTLEELRPFLSDNLYHLIIEALEYQKRFIALHPDEPSSSGGPAVIYKPPFIDDDYFSSLFEGPKSFKVIKTEAGPNGSFLVHVQFVYDQSVTAWEDVIIVIKQRGVYVIDDVIYSGAGDFNPKGRLSDRLSINF